MTKNNLEHFLKNLILNDDLHASWLNTLSYLEYRGARKIIRALKSSDMTESILKHLSEEVRHALYFKKMSQRLGGKKYSVYFDTNRLGIAHFKSYYFKLDAIVNDYVKGFIIENKVVLNPTLFCYHLMTWLIEERALEIYQTYQRILADTDHIISIEPVLVDEENHLIKVKKEIQEVLLASGFELNSFNRLDRLVELENNLFLKIGNQFISELKTHQHWNQESFL